jgi:hypothetical protein
MESINPGLDQEEIQNIQEVIVQLNEWCKRELPLEEVKQLSMDLYTLHDNLEFDIEMMKEYQEPKSRFSKRDK